MDRRSTILTTLALTASLLPAWQAATPEVLTTMTDLQIRDVLATTKLSEVNTTIREEKDDEGLTAFHVYEGQTLLCSLYQYRSVAEGPVTDLGITAGHVAAKAIDVKRINQWNSSTRFSKAFLDEEGDPMLASDFELAGGTTKAGVQAWIKSFAKSARSYVDFLKRG